MNTIPMLSAKEAARKLFHRKIAEGFIPKGLYQYTEHFYRVRLEKGKEKFFRPMCFNDGDWKVEEPEFKNGKPLYFRLKDERKSDAIYLVEGEKCVDLLFELGLSACTSGSASSARTANWEPLRNMRVIIWPDNDLNGFKYANEAAVKLQGIAASIEQIDIENLNLKDKGDCCDFVKVNLGTTKTEIKKLQKNEVLIDSLSLSESSPGHWEAPIPFNELKIPRIPSDILPGLYGKLGQSLSEATETPGALVTAMILGAVSAACSFAFRVSPKPGWEEPINLYILVAMEPGNNKSQVFKVCTRPLIEWEHQEAEKMRPTILAMESERKSKEKLVEKMRGKILSRENLERDGLIREISELEIELDEMSVPILPEIFSNDTTLETLGVQCHRQDGVYAILSDEGGIFNTLNGLYSGGKANIDILLKGIDGGQIRVKRRDRSLDISPLLTLSLTVQPEVIRNLGCEKNFIGRGFLERFLYLIPESNVGYRQHNKPSVPNKVKEDYNEAIKLLLRYREKFDFPDLRGKPFILKLDEGAKQKWQQFQLCIEKELRPENRLSPIKGWGAKICGYALRLAGNLHIMETCGDKAFIPQKTMETALKLMRLMIPHALASFNLPKSNSKEIKAKSVINWIKNNNQLQFSQRDCLRGLSGVSKIEELKESLDELEARNYIRIVPRSPKSEGGRPSITYEVHPVIFKKKVN